MHIELFRSKPTITLVWVWERWLTQMKYKWKQQDVLNTQIHTDKYIEQLNQQQ